MIAVLRTFDSTERLLLAGCVACLVGIALTGIVP